MRIIGLNSIFQIVACTDGNKIWCYEFTLLRKNKDNPYTQNKFYVFLKYENEMYHSYTSIKDQIKKK